MTHRTHAVAKTRAHQVRWSSRCRSRTAGAGAGARGAAAAGRGRTTQLRLSSASTLVDGSPQLQRSSHALLRPQKGKCEAETHRLIRHMTDRSPFVMAQKRGGKHASKTRGAESAQITSGRKQRFLGFPPPWKTRLSVFS